MDERSKPSPLEYRGPSGRRRARIWDPEASKWFGIRVLFRMGVFVVLSPIAFYFGPNLINYGKLTPLTMADLVPEVDRICVPTVRAMKEYQRDTGKWPSKVEDLVPKYLAAVPSVSGRFFDGDISGIPRYRCGIGIGHAVVEYYCDPGHEGWYVHGPLNFDGLIPLPVVSVSASTMPPK